MSALVLLLASNLEPTSIFQGSNAIGQLLLGIVFSRYNLKNDTMVFDLNGFQLSISLVVNSISIIWSLSMSKGSYFALYA